MGKTTNRVLSMILAVLMAVTSVTVFCIPAAAASNEKVTSSPFVDLEAIPFESVDVIDEANLDYEALRKSSDTFIINGAWTKDDLKEGNTLTYYFRDATHSVKYNAKRHFSNFTDAYKVYTSELNETNILSWVPVFIFAPGEYTDVINIHGNGILLGANAGTSPNDNKVEWDYKNFENGWKANKDWDSKNESVISAYVYNGTRVNTKEEGIFHYYLETAKSANEGVAEYECVIDGMTLGSSFNFNGNGWDIGNRSALKDGKTYTFTVTRGTVSDKHIQNSVVDGAGVLFTAHDTSEREVSAYMTDVRVSGLSGAYLVHRYHKDAFLTRCSFDGNSKSIIADNANDSFSGNSGSARKTVQDDQYFVMRHCSYTNGTAAYPFKFGLSANQSSSVTLIFDDSIFYNAKSNSGSQYGLIYPQQQSTTGGEVNSIIINNQFYQDTVELYSIFNTNAKNKYQVSPYNIHVENNTAIGMIGSVSTNNVTELDAELEIPYVVNNFHGETEESDGKPAYVSADEGGKFMVTSGFSNGFDFESAPYYLDYAKTTLSTDFALNSIGNLPANTEYIINEAEKTVYIDGTNWTDAEKFSVITPTFKAVSNDCFVEVYLDKDLTQLSNSIDLSKLGEVDRVYAVVKHENYPATTSVYDITIAKAVVHDYNAEFNAAKESGTLFSHLNLDPEYTFVYIPGIEEGNTERGFFNGKYYEFTAEGGNYPAVTGDISAIRAAYNLERLMSGKDPEFNIIIPSGEYETVELLVPATYYGVNADINPVVKGAEVTDEWTLNTAWGNTENWGSLGETGVGTLTVPAGVEGKITVNGITMRGNFVDELRTMKSDNLSINLENIVVSHSNIGNSGSYLFNITNERSSNSSDGIFGQKYADEFNVKNLFVKSVTNATRMLSEYSASKVSFDNIYVDFDEASNGCNMESLFSYFKNGSLNALFNFSITNSMLRDYNTGATASSMFCFRPQHSSSVNLEYNINISDNVFINALNATSLIEYSPSYTNNFVIKNNYVSSTIPAKIITVSEKSQNHNYWTDNNSDGYDDIAVKNKLYDNYDFSGNNFIGFDSNDSTFNMAIPEDVEIFKDCYITSNKTPNGYDGKKVVYGENDFWLDFDRSHTISEFSISSIKGSENFDQFVIDNNNLEISYVLKESALNSYGNYTLKSSDFILSSIVDSGKLTNSDKVEKNNITVNVSSGVALCYYTITGNIGGTKYTREYKINIYTRSPEPFKTSENIDERIRDFWIVDPLVVGDEGASVVLFWDGSTYEFVIGENAFASISDAYEYAQSKGVQANILMNSVADANLNVDYPINIYAPNWDTKPFMEDNTILAATSNGENWTRNDEYFNNQVIVENIVIGAGTSGGTVGVYGFTFTGVIKDTSRGTNTKSTHITLKNIVKDGVNGGDVAYIYQPGNSNTSLSNAAQNDVLDIINFYIKSVGTKQRLIGENLPAFTTFDGLWCDASASGMDQYPSYIKQGADKAAITFKNSNLRNFCNPTLAPGSNGVLYFEGRNKADITANMSSAIIFDNNIIYKMHSRVGGSGTGFLLGWYGTAYTDVTFTNNYIDGGINENCEGQDAYDTASFFHTAISGTFEELDCYGYATIVGNTFNGYIDNFQIDSGGKFVPFTFRIYDNFLVRDRTSDINTAVGHAVNVNSAHKIEGEKYSWLDFARTVKSNSILDYKFAESSNILVDSGSKTVYYQPMSDDSMVGKVTESGTTTYTLNMSGLVAENTYGNIFALAYGDTSVNNISKALTFTVPEGTDPVKVNMTISSPDKSVKEDWLLIISDKTPVFINGTVVEGTDVIFNSSKYVMDTANGISDIINSRAVSSVQYSLNGVDYVDMSTALTVTNDPEKIYVRVNGTDDYILYIVTDDVTTELSNANVSGKDIKFVAGVAQVSLEANSNVTFTYDHSKYATVTVKDGDRPVTSFDIGNGESKTYTVNVKESVLGTEKDYSLKISLSPDTNKIETIKKKIATTVFEKDYTLASISILDAAIVAADSIDTSNATQEVIDAAYNEIESAYNNLVKTADMKAALTTAQNAIDSGEYCENDAVLTLKADVSILTDAIVNETDKAQAVAKTEKVYDSISALNEHVFENYKDNHDATCTENGTKTAKCNNCDAVSTIVIENSKIEHKFSNYTYCNDATCIGDGHLSAYCDYGCGTKNTVVASGTKLEHSFSHYVENEDGSFKAVCDYGCGTEDIISNDKPDDPVDTSEIFDDIKSGSWYTTYVDYVYENGLMNGTSDNTFAPDTTMDRAMIVTIIARMAGVDTDALKNSETNFTDIETGKWYTGAVVWAVQNGITKGTSDTTFSPKLSVTREDLCVFLVRFANVAGIELNKDIQKSEFPDDSKIAGYAKDAVYACQQAGIVNGTTDGTFNPKGSATRSAVAKMITVFHANYIA